MNQTKILIIAANPWDTKRISPDEEYREIKAVPECVNDEKILVPSSRQSHQCRVTASL